LKSCGLRFLQLVTLLVIQAHCDLMAATENDFRLEVFPSFDAYIRQGIPGELAIGIYSPVGGNILIRAEYSGNISEKELQIEAAVVTEVFLPFNNESLSVLTLSVYLNGALKAEKIVDFRVLDPAKILVISALSGVADLESVPNFDSETALIHLSPEQLPRFQSTYSAIDAVLVSQADIGSLDRLQLKALNGYVAACGTLFLLKVSVSELRQYAEFAGCSGKNLYRLDGSDSDNPVVARNVLFDNRASGALFRLSQEINPPMYAWKSLCWLLGGYFLFLIFLSRKEKAFLPLLIAPVVTSLAALLVWSWAPSTGSFVLWAEAVSGRPYSSYSALLRFDGGSVGEERVAFPLELGMPISGIKDQAYDVVWNYPAPHLQFKSSLLSTHSFSWHGITTSVPTLKLTISDSVPVVKYTGNDTLRGAILAWQGRQYVVPELRSGEVWKPEGRAWQEWQDTAWQLFLRSRSMNESAVLLLPFLPDDMLFNMPHVIQHGWLLIKAVPAKAEV